MISLPNHPESAQGRETSVNTATFPRLFVVANVLLLAVGSARADEIAAPSVLDKNVPENLDDLKEIQKRTKEVLSKVMSSVVGLEIGGASGSGVIVSEDGYILTAGHVSGKPGQNVTVIFPDGKRLKGKTLGKNDGIDSGLIKLDEQEGKKFPYVEMGKSKPLRKGQWCIAIGHPNGYKEGRAPVVRVGRVIDNRDSVIQTDCTLVGGDSGGPLFDFEGKVIGIHSRIGTTLKSNLHVPVDTYRQTWDRLVSGESWGGVFSSPNATNEAYYGFRFDVAIEKPTLKSVVENSPAAAAGFLAGDEIVKFRGRAYATREELQAAIRRRQPGDEVTFEVLRGSETLTITLKVGKKPAE